MKGSNAWLNSVLFKYGIEGLQQVLKQLLAEAGAAVPEGIEKTFATVRRYHYLDVKGQSIINFFKGTHASAQTNLNSSWQPGQGEHQIITQLQLLDADNTTATAGSVPFTQGIDNAQLLDSRLTIVNNGIVEINQAPLAEFVGVLEDSASGILDLEIPIIWKGQTELTVRIDCPTAPTAINNVFMMAITKGFGTTS